jgi:hypothetical protein
MLIAALCYIEMVGELAALWEAVSSTTEFTLGRLPNETFQVEVVDELLAEFWRQEERRSCLEGLARGSAICSLDRHPARPDWLIDWKRPLDDLG